MANGGERGCSCSLKLRLTGNRISLGQTCFFEGGGGAKRELGRHIFAEKTDHALVSSIIIL
jgi:hypothetical protein